MGIEKENCPTYQSDSGVYMRTSDIERYQVRKHLMTALEISAANGDSRSSIRLARFILKLLKQREDEFVYVRPECDEYWGSKPINDL
jgi:hypothetical protein